MLDDSKYIIGLDKGNALGIIGGQVDQLRQNYNIEFSIDGGITNIVVAGMGGSVLPAEIIKSWLLDKLKLPITIVRDYSLPAFCSSRSLVIIISYSGNTEETLSVLTEALEKKCLIVAISSNGKLAKIANDKKLSYIGIPKGFQPRMAVFFIIKALAKLLEKQASDNIINELEETANWLEKQTSSWILEVKTEDNEAKKIASTLIGYPVVIYAGSALSSAALKWKININENAKQLAFYYLWPEFNHNEFIGWLNPKIKNIKVIELLSSFDHPQIAKRFTISNRLLSGSMPHPLMIQAKGDTKLKQLLWTLMLGDYISLYLAFLNGIDPTPVNLVEKLKKELI